VADNSTTTPDFIQLTADIVSSYVGHHSMTPEALPALIAETHSALRALNAAAPPAAEAPKPAVPVRKSITPDYIVCLEDGLKFKSLKRHLSSKFGMTPEEYRDKWSLPADYPMVAPRYSEQRSALAKGHGLGRKPAAPAPTARRKRQPK